MAEENLETIMQAGLKAFQSGMKHRAEGNRSEARLCLLKAAEKLLMASSLSKGTLRDSRKQLGLQLLEEADALMPVNQPTKPISLVHPPAAASGDVERAENWIIHERPEIRLDDIAGLESVKEQIRIRLLYPFTHAEAAQIYGIQPGGGLLFYGPPGTGKTMIARAVAGEMDAAFFSITPSEVMSQWVGVAEQNISRLFAEAEAFPLSVIFIDEMESLSPKRRHSNSTVMTRVVPQLLAELDGFAKRKNPILLIGATNEPWSMDSAMLRPGRLDRLIYVGPPDPAARQKILEMNLKLAPLDTGVNLAEIAAQSEGFSGADLAELAIRTRERVFCDAVHLGILRPVVQEDLTFELSSMQPSIHAQDIQLYESFATGKRH